MALISGFRPVPKEFKIIAIPFQKGSKWGADGHNGYDIACPNGTQVSCFDGGYLEKVFENHELLGLCARLRHGWGYTLYAHLDGIFVHLGDKLKRGEPFCVSGESATIYRDGGKERPHPHLHFGAKDLGYQTIEVEFE